MSEQQSPKDPSPKNSGLESQNQPTPDADKKGPGAPNPDFAKAVADEVSRQIAALQNPISAPTTLPTAKQVAASNVDAKPVFLKKDTEKKFPIHPGHLNGYVVRQMKEAMLNGEKVKQPANGLNEIGVYTAEEFDRFSAKGGLFDQHGLIIDVWHKPGQKDSIVKDEK